MSVSTAQAENFDLFTFTPPTGMQQERAGGALRYSRVNGAAYCLFEFYGAAPASGDVNQALQAEWQNLVAKRFSTSINPEIQAGSAKSGWKNAVGGASFPYQGNNSVAVLSTFATGTQAASVLMVGNEKGCLSDFETLLKGLTLKQPSATPASPTASTVKAQAVTGYRFTTTNFDDGWVATQYADWVEVRKGNVTVRMHYAMPYSDQTRNLGDKAPEFFWNQVVQARYPAQTLDVERRGDTYQTFDVAQSDATEAASGKRVHVALVVTSSGGNAYLFEIITPDQATFQTFFPDRDSVTKLQGYNKFNVDKTDLAGSWDYSSSSGGTRYYPALGMMTYNTPMSIGVNYTFSTNGTYRYAFNSIVGGVASNDSRNGTFATSNWTLSLKASTGKAEEYEAYFIAVRGGRILHLTDKKASAMTYDFERKN